MLVALVSCQSATSARNDPSVSSDTTEVVPAPEPRMSPMAIAATTLPNGTYIKIVYSSPRKRGRKIFGGLVPHGELWRTGANEATEITVTGPVKLGGTTIQQGTYALFTIPGKQSWTVILNSVLGQWGAYDYAAEHDVVRFQVPANVGKQQHEAFTIEFADDNSTLQLLWDTTVVTITVEPA